MKLVVAIKRVADTATRVRIEEGSAAIALRDVKFIMNPYDEIALEAALQLKEKNPGSEVLAVSAGPGDAQSVLRTALAMGADGALHIKAPLAGGLELDGFQTAGLLVAALRERPFDLLLFGRLAVDDQASQVGTLVARRLGIPSVAEVIRIETAGGRFRLHHLVDGRIEVVECEAPAALTAQKGLAEPRYPSLKGILAAKKKEIETVEIEPPAAVIETLRLEPPPPRKPGRIVGEGAAAVPELVRLLREEAKVLS
jgi:electron transfer flavoprotein beta subunit